MKKLCIALIRFYQRVLSPRKRTPTCRFTPTCSAYAIEAFEKRGFFAGLILTVYRVLRCNPLCAWGYDPVPEKGFRPFGKGDQHTDTDNDTPFSRPLPRVCPDYEARLPHRGKPQIHGQCQAQGKNSVSDGRT